MKIKTCYLVGLGGIGTQMVYQLCKLLAYNINGTYNLFIGDGDTYESENMTRQIFKENCLGENKAIATNSSLKSQGIYFVETIPHYIDREYLEAHLEKAAEPILFIAAVDNMMSRKQFLEALDNSGKKYVWVCPSNGEYTYTVSVYQSGKEGIHPNKLYEEIRNPTDKIPQTGCEEESLLSTQTLLANNMAATFALYIVNLILLGEKVPLLIKGNVKETYVDFLNGEIEIYGEEEKTQAA
jgi:hypothetical protein